MEQRHAAGGIKTGTLLAAGLVIIATAAALIALKYRHFEPRESTTQPAAPPVTAPA